MRTINTINTLVLVENIMGIYRNYSFLGRREKYLVSLHIFFIMCATLFSTALFFYSNGLLLQSFTAPNRVFVIYYISFQTTNSLFVLISSPFSSNYFKEFVVKISNVQKLHDTELCNRNIKKRNKKFYCEVILFCVTLALMTPVYAYDTFVMEVSSIPSTIKLISKLNLHYRFFYENFVFLELIEFVIEPLKLLNESVSVSVENLRGENVEIEIKDQVRRVRDSIDHWDETSQSLLAATGSLRKCFGVQITLSLCSMTFYFISLLYDFIGYSVSKHHPNSSIVSTICSLLSYLTLNILIVSAGQRVQIQAEKLRRNIASLHSKLLDSVEATGCAGAVAALARRMRAAPLRVRLLSSIPVQMALLVNMAALVANYTIVLLQFNHVV